MYISVRLRILDTLPRAEEGYLQRYLPPFLPPPYLPPSLTVQSVLTQNVTHRSSVSLRCIWWAVLAAATNTVLLRLRVNIICKHIYTIKHIYL